MKSRNRDAKDTWGGGVLSSRTKSKLSTCDINQGYHLCRFLWLVLRRRQLLFIIVRRGSRAVYNVVHAATSRADAMQIYRARSQRWNSGAKAATSDSHAFSQPCSGCLLAWPGLTLTICLPLAESCVSSLLVSTHPHIL